MSKGAKQENIFRNQPELLIIIAAFLAGALIIYASNSSSDQTDATSTAGTENQEQSGKTFYTTGDINVRKCGSLSCDVIGQYPINTDLVLLYDSLSVMPEWVQISWVDGGSTVFGFISKKILSENRTQIVERVVSKQPTGLSSIIKAWRPRVAYIECVFKYSDTGQVYNLSSGSGLALKYSNGTIAIVTNKHVLSDDNGYAPNNCAVKLPDNNTPYNVPLSDIGWSINGFDWGDLTITSPDNHIRNLVNQDLNWCQSRALIGESLVVLGYPSYGTDYLEITATEGIISGYDGEYYTTSAKIEQGNSGGVAISQENNCYLGIPTGVRVGAFESLGRILDVKYIFQQ